MADKSVRIYVQKDKHALFQKLSQSEEAPYDQLTDVFVAAAAVGYRHGIKSPFIGGSQHVGFWHSLKDETDVVLLEAIAIAETGEIDVLADRRQVLDIAQEFANTGIGILLDSATSDMEDFVVSVSLDALKPRD